MQCNGSSAFGFGTSIHPSHHLTMKTTLATVNLPSLQFIHCYRTAASILG